MHPGTIINFTATVSIFFAYMEQVHDARIQELESIIGATSKVLQTPGIPLHAVVNDKQRTLVSGTHTVP